MPQLRHDPAALRMHGFRYPAQALEGIVAVKVGDVLIAVGRLVPYAGTFGDNQADAPPAARRR